MRFLIPIIWISLATLPIATYADTLEIYASHPSVMQHLRAEGIVGTDDRQRIDWGGNVEVTKYIVKLLGPHNNFLCTGTIVSPTLILTAAHCVHFDDKWRSGRNKPMYAKIWDGRIFELGKRRVLKEYDGRIIPGSSPPTTTRDQFEIDVALVAATPLKDQTIGEVVGGFLDVLPDGHGEDYRGTPRVLVGFHGDIEDQRNDTLVKQECNSWSTHQSFLPFIRSNKGHILHLCDNHGGSSGSPLFRSAQLSVPVNERRVSIEDDNSFRWYIISGIHVALAKGQHGIIGWPPKTGLGVKFGSARGLWRWLFKALHDDREKYGYRSDGQGGFQSPDDVDWLQ